MMSVAKTLALPEPAQMPIDMVMHCPKCGLQHIDRPDAPPRLANGDVAHGCEICDGEDECTCPGWKASWWTNPPHKSHLCRKDDGGCGNIWRPCSSHATNGVGSVLAGEHDHPLIGQRASEQSFTTAVPELNTLLQETFWMGRGPNNQDTGMAWFSALSQVLTLLEAKTANAPRQGLRSAIAVINFVCTSGATEGLEFLRAWQEGSFDVCQKEWPEAPADCYPTLPEAVEDGSAARDRNLDGAEEFVRALIFNMPIWPNAWGQDVAAAAFFLTDNGKRATAHPQHPDSSPAES